MDVASVKATFYKGHSIKCSMTGESHFLAQANGFP